jgi:putative CocE/NonD family hydrolase
MGADTPGAPGNEWRTADAWPPYPTQETALNLWPDGSLRQEEPIEPSGLSFIYDPANPYPTLGGANLIPDFPAGIFDQRKFSTTRTDLLKFATPPLTEPLEITGNVKVRLAVSSDAPDTDFTAKLVDIFPDGDSREINLLDNIRRVKTRNGYSEFAPLLTGPEEVVVLEIDLWSIAWVFNTGHRIGLHISSSNYPRFELNPNTGANYPVDGEPMRPAVNTVRMGPGVPSSLILPVRPAVAN